MIVDCCLNTSTTDTSLYKKKLIYIYIYINHSLLFDGFCTESVGIFFFFEDPRESKKLKKLKKSNGELKGKNGETTTRLAEI